ncbi:MAG: SGNH/GDSL hydrolase family protein [Cyclobacteriaceae bacterium]
MQNRREFIKKSSIAAIATTASTGVAFDAQATKRRVVPKGTTILFQGDSITDAGRAKDRKNANDPRAMGGGYAFQTYARIQAENPSSNLSIYNRGISGNKVFQLADRWEEDALSINPDVLSILIGVNDFWHMVNGKYDGTVEIYENDFRKLLNRTKKELPNIKFMICEPFVVWGGKAITERWEKEFPDYQKAARKIADEFDATFVPFQNVFDEALKKAPASIWCPDGVHPSPAGAYLMADAWIAEFNKLYAN